MNTRLGRKKKNPPYFSHEFVITNHGDIVSVAAMLIVVGLLYRGTHELFIPFVFLQHNGTEENNEHSVNILYNPRIKDVCLVIFYTLICIVTHAAIQEYILDKFTRKLILTKVRMAKFNESVHLALFYFISTIWAVYTIINENYISNLSSLWEDYPQRFLPFWIKLFFIAQICYWLHNYPELYFQRVKKELILARVLHSSIYLLGVTLAYIGGLSKLCMLLLILHYSTDIILYVSRALHLAEYFKYTHIGFTIWNLLFIPVRMACIILGFLTLQYVLIIYINFCSYGLGKQTISMVNIVEGNYNTASIRIAAMVFLFIAQGLMVWNFITFHQRYQRDKNQSQSARSWIFGGSDTAQKKKDKKIKTKREDDDNSDVAETDQNIHKDLRKRKVTKLRS